jgi:hypothetical protein
MPYHVLPSNFPPELADRAFSSGDEVAWSPDYALPAVEWLGSHGYAVLGAELWIVRDDGIQSLPFGHDGVRGVHGNTVNRQHDEAWNTFVVRAMVETRSYLQSFNASCIAEAGQPYFNVVWVCKSDF